MNRQRTRRRTIRPDVELVDLAAGLDDAAAIGEANAARLTKYLYFAVIDLRLLLDCADCEALWDERFDHGNLEWSAGKLARHREELKQSRRLTRRWKGGAFECGVRRFDFQFQSALFSDAEDRHPVMPDKPFLRLDTIPMHILLDAGRGDP